MKISKLQKMVTKGAALRRRQRLQPVGGPGDKVFPPTFKGAVYAMEQRRVQGRDEPANCVLLDSVQSQANRMELALQEALDMRRISIPLLEVDFTDYGPIDEADNKKDEQPATADASKTKRSADGNEDNKKNERLIDANERLIDAIGKITSLQVPHRVADAILRDSELDGVAFRQSDKGKALNTISLAHATPLFELCPTALLFGMWDSTGPKGGLGPKFERAMVSEVVGVGAEVGDLLRGVRRDPLDIRAAVKVLKAADKSWSVADADAEGGVSPSKVNHSSVPFPEAGDRKTSENYHSGVTIEYAEQTTTLSLICLRRLRFPINGEASAKADAAARTVLAALGLAAATLAFEAGMGLRSRCLLWPDGPMEWELLERPGEPPQKFPLTGDAAIDLLKAAIGKAKKAGLSWEDKLTLKPSMQLLELVRRSQLEAVQEDSEAS